MLNYPAPVISSIRQVKQAEPAGHWRRIFGKAGREQHVNDSVG